MPIPILMPALSPTMETGKLAKWHVREGDSVSSGDILAEIETDKATMEVEAVDEGVVGKILISESPEDIAVNEPIAILLGDGESEADLESFSVSGGAKPAASSDAQDKIEEPAAKAEEPAPAKADAAKTGQGSSSSNGRVFSSPLARRIAGQNDLDISQINGSGPKGRVVKRDVEEALKSGTGKKAAAAPEASAVASTTQAMPDSEILKLFEEGTYELVPHDTMRKVIAQRLTQSKQTVPHFYLSVDCDLENLLSLRAKLNGNAPKDSDGKPAYKISVNDFIIKAMAVALQKVPEANASWSEEAMILHKHSDVGVAVAIPGGLLTPVIRKAESKGLAQISIEMKDYASRARKRKLMPEEYQGGSTAISNLGMFGIKNFSAVINPPHATILAVGGGEQRPVIVDGEVQVRTQMSVTLSTDHRAVDGALGAQLLGAFKACIEDPAMMLV